MQRAGYDTAISQGFQIFKDLTRILQHYGMLAVSKPFTGRLQMKMGKAEGLGVITAKYNHVECSTGRYHGDVKFEMVLHYFIDQVILVFERLGKAAIVSRTFQESFEVTKLVNKILVCIGCDRGGGDLILQMRIANRLDGNCSFYCIPISVVKKADKSHGNLRKTIYNVAMRKMIEPLHNDETFTFIIKFKEDVVGSPVDVALFAVRFVQNDEPLGPEHIPNITYHVQHPTSIGDGFVFNSKEGDRKGKWGDFDVTNTINANNQLHLNVYPLVKNGECCGIAIQCRNNPLYIFTHKFQNSVLKEIFHSVECQHNIGIQVEDYKVSYNLISFITFSIQFNPHSYNSLLFLLLLFTAAFSCCGWDFNLQ